MKEGKKMTNTKETKAKAQAKLIALSDSPQVIEYKRLNAWVHSDAADAIDLDVTNVLQADIAVKTYARLNDAIKQLTAKRDALRPTMRTILGNPPNHKHITTSFDHPEAYEAILKIVRPGEKVKPIQQVKDILADYPEILRKIIIPKAAYSNVVVKTQGQPLTRPVLFNV